MGALLTLAVLVGLDNLQVAAALGLAPMPAGRRLRLAAAFGLCEGLMPLLGLVLGHGLLQALGPWPEAVEAAVLVACGIGVLVLALREPETEAAVVAATVEDGGAAGTSRREAAPALRRQGSGWLFYGLPLVLSLDNLLAGVALGTLGFPLLLSAAVVGATSAALCLAGLFVPAWFAARLPGESGAWSGGFLVLLGLLRAWGGGA